ncbi:MAG: ABC transporter permease [Eubacteriales bacterium]|nr:ABC transporter permease [Eubacteriales bacterium]
MNTANTKKISAPGLLRQMKAEKQKLSGRHMLLIPLSFLFFLFVYSWWYLGNAKPEELANGYLMSVYQLTFLNEILVPLMVTVLASRICDMEIKGDTLKLLYTLQPRKTLYRCKYLTGLFYLLIFSAGECLLMLFMGKVFHFGAAPLLRQFVYFFISTFAVSSALLAFQQMLSMLSSNQVLPLAAGIAGSFLGLFSIFFPPAVTKLVLWGYYSVLCTVRSDWDKNTRISYFFERDFSLSVFAVVLIVCAALYLAGQTLLAKKEV